MKENGKALHRHDISDRLWEKIKDLLPGAADKQGRMAHDNQRFINSSILDYQNRRSRQRFTT
jgi:transposase